MSTKKRIAHTRPNEVGKIIHALNGGPMTLRRLMATTGIPESHLLFVLPALESEETIERGYVKSASDPEELRYWLTWDAPDLGHVTEEDPAESEGNDAAVSEDTDPVPEDVNEETPANQDAREKVEAGHG